jgi:hypothetical protein
MNPFLKTALIVGVVLAALVLLPGFSVPVAHGVIGGSAALLLLVFAVLLGAGLTLLVGGVTLLGLLIAALAVALVVLVLLSPVLIPVLLIAGLIALVGKLGRRPANAGSAA